MTTILRFNVFCGNNAKTQKMLWIQILFTRDAHNTANTSVFEGKAKKKTVNYIHHFWIFLAGWSQKMLVFTQLLECQENMEGTKHCKLKCFVNFWTLKRWYLRSFCPWQYQTPVNYIIFCTFWTDCLPWWMQKKTAGIYAFSKNRGSWRERNPVNNSVLATFGE